MATASRRRRAATAPVDLAPDSEPLTGAAALVADAPFRPDAIKAVWLRASLVLPGFEAPIHDRKVYIAWHQESAQTGLFVYRVAPEDDWTPEWFAFMPEQPQPLRGAMARNGIQIATAVGTVTLTPSGACSCSAPLKRWTPEFAARMVRWTA